MKLITCARCQSQFDVASMQPGSTFVCGKCRNTLHVPAAAPVIQPIAGAGSAAGAHKAPPATVVLSPDEMKRALASARGAAPAAPAPAAGKAQPKLPAAMEKRRQQQAQETQQTRAAAPTAPAAAAAPPAPAAEPRAPRAGRRGASASASADADAAPKKPMGLYLGIGGGVAVIGVLAFVFSGGKGDKPAETATGPTATITQAKTADSAPVDGTGSSVQANVAPPPQLVPSDEFQAFLLLPEIERQMSAGQKLEKAKESAASLKALHEWFTDSKLGADPVAKESAMKVVDAVLALEPASEWANLAKGNKNSVEMLTNVRSTHPKCFQYRDADAKEVDATLERMKASPWVSPKDLERLEALAKRIDEREKALASDTRLEIVERKKAWLSDNPLFKDFVWEHLWSDPYFISQQYEDFKDDAQKHKNAERLKKAREIAERDATIFQETNRQFRNLFGERYKLPTLSEKGRVLVAVVTWDRKSFDEIVKKAEDGRPVSPFVRAYYSPADQRIMHFIGDSLTGQDELPCAGGRVQKGADQVTFHEGTHQLQHEYGAILRGSPLRDDVMDLTPRRGMWFEEGLAEFMGAVEVDKTKAADLKDATFFHNRILLERVGQVRGDGKLGTNYDLAKKWTIREMLGPNHNGELEKKSEELAPGKAGFMGNIFYARAWGFVHFLWYYDNGKYRNNMLDYFEAVLKNQQSSQAFAKAMGRKGPDDWKGIDQEFEWYWTRLLARGVGPKNSARTSWWEPETDAPKGTKASEDAEDADEPEEKPKEPK